MKNTLLITTFLAAGTLGAMAENDIRNGIEGYDYTQSRLLNFNDMNKVGTTNTASYTQNWTWTGKNQYIDLDANNRYELTFKIYANTVNNTEDPIFNVYLAGANASILFGNHIDVLHNGTKYLDGYAGVFHCGADVSNFDNAPGAKTCILNTNIHDSAAVVSEVPATRLGSLGIMNQELVTGYHTYSIIIETFSDVSKQDLIHFSYSGANPTGTQQTSSWGIQKTFSGITHGEDLDIGVFFADTGPYGDIVLINEGDVAGLNQQILTKSRTETPPVLPPEPAPEQPTPPSPDIPEPSAFGLLAGAGALALVAARRRRSRS